MSDARRKVKVTCACGTVRWLSPSAAKRVKVCKRCHNRSIARKGYDKVQELYGSKSAIKHLREHLIATPSALERRVMQTLDDLGVAYEREHWLQESEDSRVFLIDFAIHTGGATTRFIEINGAWVHQYHTERDRIKVETIKAGGYPLLVLEDTDVNSPYLPHVLSSFLEGTK